MHWNIRQAVITLGLCALANAPAAATDHDGVDIGAGLTLTSDYLFRGVSQTLGDPAVQAYVEAVTVSGFYGYVWASNVDFVPEGEPDDGAEYEVNVAFGFATDVSEHWSVDTMLVRYVFPGTVADASYDYNELVATLSYEERYAATVGYSDDAFGVDSDGWFYALATDLALPADLSLSVRVGHYDLETALGASYAFSDIEISRAVGDVNVTLAYHDTYGDAGDILYAQAIGSRIVLSLDIEFLQ